MEDDKLQIENGNFTQIVNPLIENLIRVPFKGCELAVALHIIRKTYGYKKLEDEISITQFEKALQRGRPTIVKALKNLQLVNIVELVSLGNSKKQGSVWKINKYARDWRLVKLAELVKTKRPTGKAVYTGTGKDGLTHKRKKYNTKERIVADATFSFEEELKKLKESKRKDFKIIALYWYKKNFNFDNRDQFNAALKRELSPAKSLKGYDGTQIGLAINYCMREYPDIWTLETCHKRISDLVNKK